MAKAGLSFADPFFDKVSVGPAPNPYAPLAPTSSIGLGNLGQSAADMAMLGERLAGGTQFTLPEMRRPPDIGISESTGELFVQGRRFPARDAATALESEALLGQPGRGELPTGFVPLDEQAYQQYLGSIRAPSMGRLASKSFGRGVDIQQLLAGRALQAFGAEELGGQIAATQEEQLRQTSPFARQFTDIGEPNRGVLDWFVGNLAEQGPNLLISALTGIGGAAAGQAAVNASTRTLAKQFLKPSNSQSVINAAKKYAADPKSLNPSEIKLLHEAASITAGAQIKRGEIFNTLAEGARGGLAAGQLQAARTIGAGIGLGAQGYVTGVGDIYGSTIEAGDPDRATALALGIPYAALEGLTEFAIAKRILGTAGATRPTIRSIQGTGARAAEVGKRAGVGLAVGGTLEGVTEASQEALLLGVEDVDWDSPEGVNRLVNSFAAGFGIGGPLGGIANIPGKAPANLLDPGKTTEPLAATTEFEEPPAPPPPRGPQLPLVVAPGTQGELFGQVGPTSPIPGLAAGAAAIPGVAGQYTPVGGFGVAPATDFTLAQGDLLAPGPLQANIFGGAVPATEYPVGVSAEGVSGAVPVAPGQLPFQFAPAAPTGIGFTETQPVPETQIAQQFQSIQRQAEFDQAMAQRREAETAQAEAQRQLQLAQTQAAAPTPTAMPMVPAQPRLPQQLPLFGQRGLPRPSGAERLRRGATPLPESQEVTPPTQKELERAGQMRLFTRKGEPTVAALKGAGKRRKIRPQLQRGGRQRPSEPAAKIRAVAEKIRKRQRVDTTYDNGERYVGIVTAEGNLVSGTYTYADGTTFEGTFENNAPKNGVYTNDAGEKLQVKDGNYAVQERGAEEVSTREPAETGAGVGEKVSGERGTAAKGEALKTKKQPVQGKQAPPLRKEVKEERPTPPKKEQIYESPDEAWEDMKPDDALALSELSPVQQAEWIVLYESGRVSIADAAEISKSRTKVVVEDRARVDALTKRIREERAAQEGEVTTDKEEVNNLIERIETTKSKREYRESLANLMDWLYNVDENNKRAGLDTTTFNFLNDLPIDDSFREALVEFGRAQGDILVARNRNDVYDPMFSLVLKAQMLDPMRQKFGFQNLPPEMQLAEENKVVVKDKEEVTDMPEVKAMSLANMIDDYNSRETPTNDADRKAAVKKLTKLFRVVKADGLEDFADVNGVPLSDFFTDNDKPKTVTVGGRFRVVTEIPKEAEKGRVKTTTVVEEKPQEPDVYVPKNTLADWESGRYFRDDGQPISRPLDVGRLRMAVQRFVAKLVIKPRVVVFKNQADLKAKDPELYAQAVAARPQGDFDTVSAVGYSFGDGNVIIFSDRVSTEQQLNFVLAHETMGHFGFRALIPQNKFNALMEDIYNRSPAIQAGVDAAMSVRNMPKAEAVEEYLADFAAQLDNSLVSRIWNAIKGALNKLGVKFGDEAARYFIDQSRRYVRNGDRSAFFTAQGMIARLQAIENGFDPDDTGRFAQTQTLREVNVVAGLMQDNIEGRPMNVDDAIKYFKDQGIDFSGGFDKFVGKFFNLLAFRSRRNAGFAELEKILSEGRDISMSTKVAMKEKMAEVLNRAVTLPGTDLSVGGISPEQMDKVNEFLYAGQRFAVSKLDRKRLTPTKLFSVDKNGVLVANQAEIDKFYKMGLLTFEQMRDGFSFDISYAEEGKTKTEKVTIKGINGLTENSPEWKGYLAVRETMRDVELKLLKARYLAYVQDRDLAYREIAEVMKDGKVTSKSKRFLDRMYDKYRELWTADQTTDEDGNFKFNGDSIENANEFLKILNTAILGKDTDRNAEVAKFFPKIPAKEISDSIEEFKTELVRTEENKFEIQNRMKDIIVAELSNEQADAFTIRSLATGYTPLLRRGEYEVRVTAYNKKGEPVLLKQDYKDQLVYRQFENESEAVTIAEMMNKDLFGDKTYKVEARNRDGEYELMDVKIRAEANAAIDSIAAPPQLNLNEFTRGLRQFNIVLTPQKLEQVIVALTAQNNRARQRLERKFVPGYDPDAIRAVTEHVESRASTIAKVIMRPRISELMNLRMKESRDLWYGNRNKLATLKTAWENAEKDPALTDAQKLYAKRMYDEYAYKFNETNPQGKARRGNQFYNEASGLLQFLENNRDINESDFGAGEVASRVRAYTSIFQLGGSIATGALNFIGAVTNGIPYLATYNPQNSFGGGFGFGKSFAEFQRALSNVGLRRAIQNSDLNTAEFYEGMATNPQLLTEYGLKDHEAKFIAREIREGAMIPAQSNALTETARGRVQSGAWQKAMDGFMWTFNATEQASRRAVGLAAYRLEYERRKAAGRTDAEAAEFARVFAVDALKLALGEYSVINRPPAWRTGIQSFLYMYKVFPTTSIQLLRALPRNGQVYMLASMWVLAGISGFPFAEDLEDIIDTIAQKLGFRAGSIRYEIAQVLDSVAPGVSKYVFGGASNWILPADLAGRVSLGDFVPGTGILLAGADVGREIKEVAGPAASMILGVGDSISTGIKAATTEKVTFEDWLRNNPITAARIFGDSLAYVNSGAIVDRRGYVVADDASADIILTRLLGFYPRAAADQYNFIRISTRITDYQKEVSAGFRQAWIKAMIRGDMDQARSIVEAVNDWNEGADGTALEIRNFQQNARKALREAQRPAGERLLKSAPRAAREDIEQVADYLGY